MCFIILELKFLFVKLIILLFMAFPFLKVFSSVQLGFPGGSEVKASAWNAGEPGSIPGSGRSPGEGNGNSLQYSCLENPVEGGTWWARVLGVAKSRTRLSKFTSLHFTSVAQLCLTRCDPMDCSTPGLPVHHQLPEFTQTHVH